MEELLRILEKNARMPIEDIAAMLDKTPEEIAAMMDEAAAKGYIRGYETLVDWEQAGVNLVEAVIELRVTPHKARGFDDIGMTIAQFDEVDTVLLMSGSYDLQVIIPEPCFVCYEPITQLTGGVPVHIATRAEDQFRLTADQLRAAITPRTKLLIFPYPNNPTGAVMSAAEMEEIAAVLRETNVLVLSDEIYSELTYGLDRHVSIASLPGMAERTIVVNGFSKSYAMTGWRLGYAAGPAPLVKVMTKIHQSCIMSAPTTSQYAAITALRQCDDQIEMMRDEYNRRRRYVVKALNEMGLTCFEPRGAFYVFPSIQISGLTSSEFCEQLLREKEVAIIPGSAFGASGEGYARISYAYSVDHLQTAMKRIREFLTEHGWMKK